ncbi:hypothetical protein D3C83_322860 [compost metagenome]
MLTSPIAPLLGDVHLVHDDQSRLAQLTCSFEHGHRLASAGDRFVDALLDRAYAVDSGLLIGS